MITQRPLRQHPRQSLRASVEAALVSAPSTTSARTKIVEICKACLPPTIKLARVPNIDFDGINDIREARLAFDRLWLDPTDHVEKANVVVRINVGADVEQTKAVSACHW